MTARGNGGRWSERFSRGCAAALAVAALVLAGDCGTNQDDGATQTVSAAFSAQDVLGFESLDAWTPSSGTEALTTTHTQGAFAYALTAPVNFTNIVGAAIDNTTPNLQGLTTAGSSLALDMVIPTQQPNQFFFGSVQLLVSVPSRNVNNLFIAQVELTGLPLGSFQTLRFAVPDSLRNSLRGATFNDLSFTVALNAPSGATGTYIFDNLRAVAANNAEFSLTPSPAAVTVVQGATAQSTIAVARVGGFAAGVALTATGLPTGVTATFNPATATGASSVVTFSAAAGAALGPATVTITGTGGGLSRTATIALTVAPAPNFTLAASPAALTVVQGATAQSTITIARQNGFSAAVALSATGLPAGVTAAFNPASTAGASSVVTFTAAANAAPGTATVTITGTGGGLTRTTTIALTVAAAANFTLAASPASVTVVQGATAQITVTITRQNGFAAAVAFTAAGLPAGVTAAFNPASTTGASSVVTFTAAANAALGTATVTITGTGGGLTQTTTIALTVAPAPDFTLAAAPASVTVVQGATAQSTITISPLNGFAASVALGATGLPAGVTAVFTPASTTSSSVVTFSAALSAALGTATVTITGTGGGLTRTTAIALTVAPAPDFALAASPAAVTVVQGATAQSTVTIVPLNGFAAAVTFSTGPLPAGVTASFAPPTTAGPSTTLTFTAAPAAALGPATVTITGTGGGLTRTTTIAVTVAPAPDFALTVSPAAVTVIQGATAGTTVTIAQLNGFSAPVTFAASGLPAGVTATFAPPTTAGPTTSLTFSAALDAALGPATVTITGTGGGLTRTTSVALTVAPAPDFTLAASPAAVTVVLESTATSTVTVTPLNGFAAAVSFSASGLPDGVTATFAPPSATDASVVTFAASAAAVPGSTTVTITGVGGGLVRSTTVALTVAAPTGDFSLDASPVGLTVSVGGSATTTIAITRIDGFPSTITFSASGLPSGVVATFTPPATTGDSTTLTLTALDTAVTGPATVTITGTGGTFTRTTSITLLVTPAVVEDFSLTASPAAFSISQGDSVTGTITITRINGFADAVGFSASGLPAGVTATFTPASTTDDSVAFTLTAAADAAAGSATVTITGTGGGLTRTTTVDLVVNATPAGDFTISAVPTAFTIAQGDAVTGAINIARTGGFADAVSFTASGLPAGVTATFTPSSTTGDSVGVTLTAAADAATGPATVTVTGTSPSLTRTTTISLVVNATPAGDFALSARPAGLSMNQGDTGVPVLITIDRQGGFAADVSFGATGLPAGVTATFSPPDTTDTSVTMLLSATPTATTGPATIVVSGTGGGLTRTVPINIVVSAGPSGDFGLNAVPSAYGVNAGDVVSGLITIDRFGFTGPISFAATGLPPGVTVSFNPPTTADVQTVITFTVAPDAPTTFSTITIVGSGSGLMRTVPITLLVNGS